MSHGHHHGEKEPLPEVKFKIVDLSVLIPVEVNDRSAESYGFNRGGTAWDQSITNETDGRYLRWLQPMESELAKQVEYDMDEQDQHWLDAVNDDRRKDGIPVVSYEVFEIIIDKLEKDWFDLTKSIPKRSSAMPNEDSKCAICDDGECENSNAIVFCDGCNLAVHQDCYGVPYIPEGQWLCRKCTVSPDKPVTCVLCPNSYGAFKQTTTNQWAHLLCAIWIPDTGVSNTVYMEPIDGVENISKNRWKLVCYLCRKKVGACIQCANRSCFQAFHVTCAREAGLEIRMKQGGERGELKAYCDKHSENMEGSIGDKSTPKGGQLPSASRKNNKSITPFQKSSTPSSTTGRTLTLKLSKSNKSARAYKQTYSTGPPLVPNYIFTRLVEYLGKIKLARKPAFVGLVCKYWSLKRESRRGAPLLKRLHLEPWTASATSRHQTDVEKAKKLELIRLLRNDLEKLRMLTEQVRKRERKKLERVNLFKEVVERFVFPKERIFRDILKRIDLLDKLHIFAQPVSKILVPDYYDIIKNPMDWATIGEKLDRHEYLTAVEFQDDIELVLSNARRYNKADTPVHKAALKVGLAAEPILAELALVDQEETTALKVLPEVLTMEQIESLFDFNYDDLPDSPLANLDVTLEEAGGDVNGGPVASGIGTVPESVKKIRKKRQSKVAQLGEGEGSMARSSPRTRREATVVPGAIVDDDVMIIEPELLATPEIPIKNNENATQVIIDGITPTPLPLDTIPLTSPKRAAAELEEVDSRTSFQNFHSGWMLPEGSSRRRSKTAVPEVPPTPVASSSRQLSIPPVIIETPIPVVSVARTPKSRKGKEKAIQEDQDEDAADAAAVEASVLPARLVAKDAVTSPLIIKIPTEIVKKVTSLPVAPIAAGQSASTPMSKSEWEKRVQELKPLVQVTDETELLDGMLFWAKTPGYASFPAEIADPELDKTSEVLKNARPPSDLIAKKLILVKFFDDGRRGSWVPREQLRFLGENEEFDQLYLSEIGIKTQFGSKTKASKSITSHAMNIKMAYDEALDSMSSDEEDAASEREEMLGQPSITSSTQKSQPKES